MTASQMNRSRWMLGLGLVATASFAVPALAEPPATSTSNGLMTFPNVRVENAPVAQQAAAKSKSDGKSEGMRAAVDPATGQLRPVTADEAAQLSAKPKAQATLGAQRRTTAAATEESATSDAGQIMYGPDNAVGLTVGDDQMSYLVVRKTPEGLATKEFKGAKAAAQEVEHGR